MNTEQRIDNIELMVNDALERNTQAFLRLIDTMDSVKNTMIELTQVTIENQNITAELSAEVEKISNKVNRLEEKLS
ncbi:hypothetical protein [Lacrimispora sp.]|uniref:hypothetical protein n=1 Tax=Lacrimispora sp. TaxID=2719234 RepID=UPI0028AB0042|nr:hypothetical protein [Lacrimispora sp.]